MACAREVLVMPVDECFYSFVILCVCVCGCLALSCVSLSATPWTIAYQTPLFMVLFQQEYWSGLPFSPSGYLPDPKIKPTSHEAPALAGKFFTTEPPGKSCVCLYNLCYLDTELKVVLNMNSK